MRKPKSGISRILARMTVIPLLVFGIFTTMFSIYRTSSSMEDEVRNELQALAGSAVCSLDFLYPGDYACYANDNEILITKGDSILNSNYALIDNLKENTDTDYTIFYGNMRIITTLCSDDGERLTGTYANPQIVEDVIRSCSSAFYSNVDIFGQKYFCYYEPLCNSDGSCVGMIAVLLPSQRVQKLVLRASLPILLLSLFAIILAALWSLRYSSEFISVIHKLTGAFSKASHGVLSHTVPPELLARKDEFGEMSHSLVDMQASLRQLVEQDMLTGLCNRRFGQQKLDQLIQQNLGTRNHFSIALGDIDFFKKFNDNYGHDCGDYVLQSISDLMKQHVKDFGYCIRWGGEEFLIVLTKGTFSEHEKLMHNLIEQIRQKEYVYHSQNLTVTMTFGLIDALEYTNSDEMVKAVDELLYFGKESGRNRLVTKPL